jgi:two-component system, sensor histidine kinase
MRPTLSIANNIDTLRTVGSQLRARAKSASEPAISQELFRLGYRNLWIHLIGQICLSSIVGLAALNVAPPGWLMLWTFWMLLASAAIMVGLFTFRRRGVTPGFPVASQNLSRFSARMARWRASHLIIVCLIGVGWGGVGFLLQPGMEQHNIMLFISFAGAMAYSSASNGPHDFRGFVVSALIALGILATQLPRTLGPSSLPVLAMSGLFFLVLSMTAFSARLALIRSISLRLKNEELAAKNAESATRAEQANREKSEFLAATSHDLRQPVHALMLLLEAYERDQPVAARHPLIRSIAASGQSIADLFNSLMETSRLENLSELPKPMLFDVAELMERVFERIRPEAENKGLKFKISISKNVPRRTLLSDRSMFERVLSNLLTNAIRYTPVGSVLFVLRSPQAIGGLWIEVWDSGLGIAPENQVRIFEPYVQLSNPQRDRSKGLGLGLSNVKRTLELLGMRLVLDSKLDQGSRFRILIPAIICKVDRIRKTAQTTEATRDAQATSVDAPVPLSGQKILLIDDDAMVQSAMLALLRAWGAEVRAISSIEGIDLVTAYDGWAPDSVLSDYRLPGRLNGLETLQLIRARLPGARCILQTGELEQIVEADAKVAGVPVLFKPVPPKRLLDALVTAL